MDVLHYSFSLSACPKCHLLVCKHTSLANLDFLATEQEEEQQQQEDDNAEKKTSSNPTVKTLYQRLSSHGMNFYVLPSTTVSDNRHSWTTFGTGSVGSNYTIDNSSVGNDTLCDNIIPFANENIIHTSLPIKPRLTQIVRTQSERCPKNSKPRLCLTKSYSFSTIYPISKSNKSSTLSPHIQVERNSSKCFSSNCSILLLSILILSYLITNTLDIVLIYIYYQTNSIYFLSFLLIVLASDVILWINNLIERKNLPTQALLIPFALRFHILYELVELMLILLNQTTNLENTHSFHSSSSSTTTTLETNLSDSSLTHSHHQQQQQYPSSTYQNKKRRLFHYLALFYLIHSSFLIFINLYFWSNHFQISSKSTLNMNYFLPQWTTTDNPFFFSSSSLNIIPLHPSHSHWSQFDSDRKLLVRRAMSFNWTRTKYSHSIPLRIRLPSSSAFILSSIFYHLIVNYCLLSTFLTLKRRSLMIILSILSRCCLILTRIYTLIFLFRLNAWWFTMTFFLVHFSLMMTLLLDRRRHSPENSTKFFLQFIFSFVTHCSINDISINAVISLENISIVLHRLYLETFSSHNETTLRLIIFLSILISLQIIGFLFDILSKYRLHRSETTNQPITKV